MSESPMFKRAFVRGLNAELTRRSVALYPSKEAADYAADFVADHSGMPDPLSQPDGVTFKVAEALCENLVKASQELCKQAGNKYDSALSKTAAASDPSETAYTDSWALMQKAAAETGSLSEGEKHPNTMSNAAKDNGEAALEQKRRPEGYAHLGERGVGGYEDKGKGAVGTEEKHPEAPKATGHGSNSATENTSKMGSLARILRKVANNEGSLMQSGADQNTLSAAASSNAEAAQELSRRPEGYAHMGERGVGKTEMKVPSGAVVGREQPHPEPGGIGETAPGDNSIIEQTKNAFDQLFEATAQDVVGYLPEKMDEQHKIAHVRSMMGLESSERGAYLRDLYVGLNAKKEAAALVHNHYMKTAAARETRSAAARPAAKTAGTDELPPALRKKIEEKVESKHEEPSMDEKPMKHEPMYEAKPFAGKETVEEEVKEHGKDAVKDMGKKASASSLTSLRSALARLNA